MNDTSPSWRLACFATAAAAAASNSTTMNETTSLRWRAHAAKAAMNYHTLDRNSDEKNESDAKHKSRGRLCCGTTILDGVAATAVASSMVTWMASTNILVKIASAGTFVFGPLAACQQRKLRNFGTLRNHQNQLRAEVNYLYQEQERLQRSLTRLDSNVMQIETMERELSRLAGSKHNINRLLDVVHQQEQVYDNIKENLKKSVLQSILTALVQSDGDGNFVIHSREMEVLVVRLNMMEGVKFHEQKFRQLIGTDSQSLATIMRLIRSLLQDDDETVFVLCPEEMTK